jgi:pimeloyl-ACP methyl ester carboxylesterase
MISDYPPSGQPAWRLVVQETLAFMATALLYPFGLRRVHRPTPRLREQRTVVFVHGYLCNPAVFLPMAAYLRHRGLRQVLPFGYPSTHGVERGAIALRRFLKEQVRGGEIDLVCHSLGGLVARSYLQELGGARRVARCVTLGTPHFGTYNAYWLASRVGKELRPDSDLLRRLRASRAATEEVRFLSVIGGSDNLVIPRVFAAHEEEICVPDLGHMAMLYAPSVWRLVAAWLLDEAVATQPADAAPPPFFSPLHAR